VQEVFNVKPGLIFHSVKVFDMILGNTKLKDSVLKCTNDFSTSCNFLRVGFLDFKRRLFSKTTVF